MAVFFFVFLFLIYYKARNIKKGLFSDRLIKLPQTRVRVLVRDYFSDVMCRRVLL
jgi:hypothetical protein